MLPSIGISLACTHGAVNGKGTSVSKVWHHWGTYMLQCLLKCTISELCGHPRLLLARIIAHELHDG